jgi:TonB family protein
MRSSLVNSLRICFIAALGLSVVPSTFAQLVQFKALTSRMADSIAQSKNRTAVVFDFASPDGTVGALGTELADEFSSALAGSGDRVQVEDRARVKQKLEDEYLQPGNINDPGVALWLAGDLGAQVLVLGRLDHQANIVNLSVSSYRAKDGKEIAAFKVAIPLTQDMTALTSETLAVESPDDFISPNGKCISSGSPPCSITPGYSTPKCISCPAPAFSRDAVSRGAQGTVILLAVIDVDGKAKNIRVMRALPYGLSLQAAQTIQKWRFQPATGPDGVPAAVRQLIEVTFHFTDHS